MSLGAGHKPGCSSPGSLCLGSTGPAAVTSCARPAPRHFSSLSNIGCSAPVPTGFYWAGPQVANTAVIKCVPAAETLIPVPGSILGGKVRGKEHGSGQSEAMWFGPSRVVPLLPPPAAPWPGAPISGSLLAKKLDFPLYSPLGLWFSKTSSLPLKNNQTLHMCGQAGPHETLHGSCVLAYLLIRNHTPPLLFSALLEVFSVLCSDTGTIHPLWLG